MTSVVVSTQVTKGRAQKALEGSSSTEALQCLVGLFGKEATATSDVSVSQKKDDLHKLLQPHAYALAAGKRSVATVELGKLPAIRWSYKGTRSVAIFDFQLVLQFMEKVGADVAATCGKFVNAQKWVSEASEQQLHDLLGAFPLALRFCTVGPSDVLYLPAGVIMVDQVLNASDHIGVRTSVLYPDETVQAQLQACVSSAPASKDPAGGWPLLMEAVEAIATACEGLAAGAPASTVAAGTSETAAAGRSNLDAARPATPGGTSEAEASLPEHFDSQISPTSISVTLATFSRNPLKPTLRCKRELHHI